MARSALACISATTLGALGLSAVLSIGFGLIACAPEQPEPVVSFQQGVRPLLQQHCLPCHTEGGTGFEQTGLRLDSFRGLMAGTRLGPVVVPGDSASSTFNRVAAGRADASIQMPHGGAPLSEAGVVLLDSWVDQGAKDN